MYQEIIARLKEMGIKLEQGLSYKEIDDIEKKYEILFPYELKEFYSVALPVSDSFVNWRDTSKENIEAVRSRLERPFSDLRESVLDIEWNDDWGEEPSDIKVKRSHILKRIDGAPRLIPIYSHRYIVSSLSRQSPVLSIYGIDVIYYGENLRSYFEIEFGERDSSDIQMDRVSPVPFWSDLL